MIRAFKYRLYPTKAQAELLSIQMGEACKLYNVALEHRIYLYRAYGVSVNYNTQAAELKGIRKDGLCLLTNFSSCQKVLKKLDRAYADFFRRIKLGEKTGHPRFKSSKRYNVLEYTGQGDGCRLKDRRLYLQGIGDVKIRLHRKLIGKTKNVYIKRSNGKFFVIFNSDIIATPLEAASKNIGIDMGLENFAISSNGEFFNNPRFFKKSQQRIRVLSRSLARKSKGSNNRSRALMSLSVAHEKTFNQRRDYSHKLSRKIINENDVVCIEDLSISSLARGYLSKSIHDAGWGVFFNMIAYKAEEAGRVVVRVNPRNTSQECNKCGRFVKKTLSDRWHLCECGESIHRDHNSALNILRLGTSLCKSTWDNSSSVLQEAKSSSRPSRQNNER